MIKLYDQPVDNISVKIQCMIYNDTEIGKVFWGKDNRLISGMPFLIKEGNREVGFINLVNDGIKNLLFLDLGIKKDFRNKKYSDKSLEILLNQFNIKEYIIGEVAIENIAANKMSRRIAELIYTCDNKNFYLFQRSKKKEFLNSEEFELLKKHVNSNQKIKTR